MIWGFLFVFLCTDVLGAVVLFVLLCFVNSIGAGIVVEQGKPPTVQILAALFPIQFPADAPGKAVENGLSAWSPVTHVGVPDGVSCSFFGPGPDLVPISI